MSIKVHVIGGTYKESCSWPNHSKMLGSAGRAALCLSQLDPDLTIILHARVDPQGAVELQEEFTFSDNVELSVSKCEATTSFEYFHPLSEPIVTPPVSTESSPEFNPSSEKLEFAVVFGMIEATPLVKSSFAIYDPQNTYAPVLFSETGSTADTLIYITNSNELSIFYKREHPKSDSIEEMSTWLLQKEELEVVFVKCGQRGVYVNSKKEQGWVSPYKTESIFPIGSGDAFMSAITYYLKVKSLSYIEAARRSSIATAYYVSYRMMNNDVGLEEFSKNLEPVKYRKNINKVYLAGPFFTLSQLWLVNETKRHIKSFGMDVFSPFHEVGIGSVEDVVHKDIEAIQSCDLMYALFDGTDPGTLFEIGYARSLKMPVIILAENPKAEELKMYDGSGCKIYSDFASSIYNLAWLSK